MTISHFSTKQYESRQVFTIQFRNVEVHLALSLSTLVGNSHFRESHKTFFYSMCLFLFSFFLMLKYKHFLCLVTQLDYLIVKKKKERFTKQDVLQLLHAGVEGFHIITFHNKPLLQVETTFLFDFKPSVFGLCITF